MAFCGVKNLLGNSTSWSERLGLFVWDFVGCKLCESCACETFQTEPCATWAVLRYAPFLLKRIMRNVCTLPIRMRADSARADFIAEGFIVADSAVLVDFLE